MSSIRRRSRDNLANELFPEDEMDGVDRLVEMSKERDDLFEMGM